MKLSQALAAGMRPIPVRPSRQGHVGARPTGTPCTGRILAHGARSACGADSPLTDPTRVDAVLGGSTGVTLQASVETDRSRNRQQARKPRPVAG